MDALKKRRNRVTHNRGGGPAWLLTFEIGERRWVETTLDSVSKDRSQLIYPQHLKSGELMHMKFKTSLHTAVGTKAGDIHYLIMVERIS